MKIYKTEIMVCALIGLFLGFALHVAFPTQALLIPQNEDLFNYRYGWDSVTPMGYMYRGYGTNWNTVRTQANSNYKYAYNPPFQSLEVQVSQRTSFPSSSYDIRRSIIEIDISNVSDFYGIYNIVFNVSVISYQDADNNALLVISNGTSFQYNNHADYSYWKHYFASPVDRRQPNGYGTITATGNYYIGWNNIDKGFSEYARNNKINVSFVHGDDFNNNPPALSVTNYIKFNVTDIWVYYIPTGGFPSQADYWDLVSIPCDEVIHKNNMYVRNDTNNYTWAQAVSNGIIKDYIYNYSKANQEYQETSYFNGSLGHWLYFYYDDYELWNSSFEPNIFSGSTWYNTTRNNSHANCSVSWNYWGNNETFLISGLNNISYLYYTPCPDVSFNGSAWYNTSRNGSFANCSVNWNYYYNNDTFNINGNNNISYINCSGGNVSIDCNASGNFLYIAGLDLEPPLIVLSIFFLLFWVGNDKEDALLMLVSGVFILSLAIYYIAEFTLLSELVAVGMIGLSGYCFMLGFAFYKGRKKS